MGGVDGCPRRRQDRHEPRVLVGQWIITKLVDHEAGCFGAPTPADGATAGESASACKSAFTAKQVARAVLNSPLADLDMSLAIIRAASSTCFFRAPGMRFMGSVKRAARISMTVDRAVDMAALPGYADALGACGHKATQRLSRPCCPLFRSPSGMPHSSLSVISPGSSVQHRRPHNARDPDQGGEAHSRAEEEEWHAAKWRHFQRG